MTMTDTELEGRVAATLRAKGAQVMVSERPFDLDAIASVPLAARGRRRLPVLVAAVVALVVIAAIGVALVLVDRDEATKPAGAPQSPPVSQLQIVALPTLSYQAAEFTTEPGVNEIEFVSQGTHTLTFSDPALRDFQLNSYGGRPARGTVVLAPGRDYEIGDVIPGHRDAGEVAVIHVTDGPSGPTRGPLPDPVPELPDRSMDLARLPDYIEWPPGYAKQLDLSHAYRATGARVRVPVPIYGEDLTTLIGHLRLDRGFVPLGVDPDTVTPSTTVARSAIEP
jgi:hypothetical protein